MREVMECRTCRYSIEDGGATLCTNEDRLWSESPAEVASYQVCRLWMPKGTGGLRDESKRKVWRSI